MSMGSGRRWFVRSALASSLLLVAGAAHARESVRSFQELRRDRLVMQEWDLSCGAAAIATLLNYQHGDDVTEREVALALMQREEYIENPDLVRMRQGFSLLDLKRYVDARGYEGVGFGQMSYDDIIARAPIMVPINTRGYNHFCVFRGSMGNRVLLGDPAVGNRTMTIDRFNSVWLEYPDLGHVGFLVQRRDGLFPPNRLAPEPRDFVMLR